MTSRTVTVLTFAAALVFALAAAGRRGDRDRAPLRAVRPAGEAVRAAARSAFRPGLLTDLTHILVNGALTAVAVVALVVVAAIPVFWIRRFDLVGDLPGGGGRAGGGAGRGRQLLGSPAHAPGAVPVALPFGAPQHRADGLGRVGSAAPARPGVHPGVHGLPAVPARLRRRRVRRRRGVHHAARAVPARQRAAALPRPAVGHQHPRVAPLAPRASTTTRATRTSASRSSTRSSAPRTCRRAGGRSASAPSSPVPADGYLRHLAYPFTPAAKGAQRRCGRVG